jgi:hypothetical protein
MLVHTLLMTPFLGFIVAVICHYYNGPCISLLCVVGCNNLISLPNGGEKVTARIGISKIWPRWLLFYQLAPHVNVY